MFLQALNVVASEVMVGDTCIPSLIVINTTINQLDTNNIYCLKLFGVVYKHVMLQHQRKKWVKDLYKVLLLSTVQLTS